MAFPKNMQMPTAITKRSNIDLSCQHVTTTDFMRFDVAKSLELVPGQSISVDHSMFTRLEPMPVPTFGNASIHSKAFFVPFRTIMPAWNEFITDTLYVNNQGISYIPSTVPCIPNQWFVDLFIQSRDLTVDAEDSPNPDILYRYGSYYGDVDDYNLTPYGRVVLKLLYSLGYKIDWRSYALYDNGEYSSLLPLLAVAKIYADWYYPSQYAYDERFANVLKWFQLDYDSDLYVDDFFTLQDFRELINFVAQVCYDSDYFTSAWDNPVAPNWGASSSASISDVTTENDSTVNSEFEDYFGTPLYDISNTDSVTQFGLTALKAMTDYMKRHQLSGSRVLDRYLSRFGIKLGSEKLKRSQFVGEFTQRLEFGDVTSTADTEGATLGMYAGKGYGAGSGHYEYTADEYGMFIVITSIVPKTSYYQGQDRNTMHITKTDFFTPEYDNLGVQALSTKEVYVPFDADKMYDADYAGASGKLTYDDLVFGFVPRFAEYKRGFDLITGDYILNSKNATRMSWTLFRDLSPLVGKKGLENFRHDLNFVRGLDSSQYNRIFDYTDNNADHFNVIHNFKISSSFPGASLWDSYEFEDEDKAKKVNIEVGGVKAN